MTDHHPPPIRVFDEWKVRSVVDDRLALMAAERAFRALARGGADVPPPINAGFERIFGEIHVKGAHLEGSSLFVFKFATGFYGNVELGMPTGSGLVLLFEASTGFPRGLLLDNGYLTDLRTAAAGALATRLLTHDRPLDVAVLGTGVQGRSQLRMISAVRSIRRTRVWSRRESARHVYVERMSRELDTLVSVADTVAEAVSGADLVVTTTPARAPLVMPGMLKPGATVVAVGSDGPGKQELAAEVVAQADKVITDRTSQCAELGELHHAIEAGLMTSDDVYAELGRIVVGEVPGREGDETIVCDLTGVGAQDAALAEAVFLALTPERQRPDPEG